MRYELNGVEIDRNKNVGITSTLKNYVTVFDRNVILRNAGWDALTAAGYFNFYASLYILLGFCEDYKRVVINARHKLILIRARNDNNCLMGDPATEPTLELFKIQWRMPHVLLSEINKLSMLRALDIRGRTISEHGFSLVGSVRVSALAEHNQTFVGHQDGYLARETALRHFRYANRSKKVMSEDVSRFDDCKLTNAKLYLNSECYPYDDLNLLIKTDSVRLVRAFLQGLLRITSTSSRVSPL